MSHLEKEKLIKADIASIESRVRHAFNQGYDLGFKDGKERSKPLEPKTGHWMDKQRLFDSCSAECSSCHERSDGYMDDNGFSLVSTYYDYCPKCGAKMVEPQESEGKA